MLKDGGEEFCEIQENCWNPRNTDRGDGRPQASGSGTLDSSHNVGYWSKPKDGLQVANI